MSTIDPGPGYRLLKEREPRKAGMEYTKDEGDTWQELPPKVEGYAPMHSECYPHRVRVSEQPKDDLPQVAGRMEMTHADFQRACRVQLDQQEDDPMPNKALINVLYEAVRCSREAVELAESKAKLGGEFRWHPASEPPCLANTDFIIAESSDGRVELLQPKLHDFWPPRLVRWYPIPSHPAPEPDDGFQKWWDGLPTWGAHDPKNFRHIGTSVECIEDARVVWQAALAAQKGKP